MRWRATSLRVRARIAYGSLAVIVLLGVALSALSFSRVLDERNHLADDLDPAAFAVQRWYQAYLDQESGVRGYVLSGDETFLAPYRQGRAAATASERRARASLADEEDLLPVLARFDDAATAWERDQAGPLVEATRAEGPSQISRARLVASKEAFDDVRQRFAALSLRLDRVRDAVEGHRDGETRRFATAAGATVVLLTIGLGATWFFLRRSVLDPIARLGTDARSVADGHLDHAIAQIGAPEMGALATDMESMRRRILAEVAVVDEARRRLEAQAADLRRSNEELEQFAYVASHDLQEPLRKISGFCQLLERRYQGQLDERADEYIAYAVDGAKRMQRLINELLAFSRVGRTTSQFTAVDLEEVARDAVTVLQDVVDETGGRVDIGPLPTVAGDASLLAALFQNLVGNALKFRGAEPPVVELRAVRQADPTVAPDGDEPRRTDGGGDIWLFTCRDNGIGIEDDYAERVFVIFQRLHARERYEGTGIGLAMCRKIVEFHGGRIWVEPHDGTGTAICWTLPDEPHKMPTSPRPPAPTAEVSDRPLAPMGTPSEPGAT